MNEEQNEERLTCWEDGCDAPVVHLALHWLEITDLSDGPNRIELEVYGRCEATCYRATNAPIPARQMTVKQAMAVLAYAASIDALTDGAALLRVRCEGQVDHGELGAPLKLVS